MFVLENYYLKEFLGIFEYWVRSSVLILGVGFFLLYRGSWVWEC